MNTADIWKDKIILRPSKELIEIDETLFRGLSQKDKDKARADIYNKAIRKLEFLAPYTKYNKKFRAFLLPCGIQNLQRLRKQFGKDIEISPRSMPKIDEMKHVYGQFKRMVSRAQLIKGDLTIPSWQNCRIRYKIPPLGEFQHRAVLFLCEILSAPIFADCGVGKTFMVLVSTEYQIRSGMIKPGKTLICGKLPTMETGWLEDAAKFTNLKLNLLWTHSSYKKREKILQKLEEPADAYLINHEGLRRYEKELAAKNFDKVVVDESTVLKSYHSAYQQKGGKFGQALMNVAKNAIWRVVMSGTPAPNGVGDLWGQFYFLNPEGFLLEPDFYNFRNTYMKEVFFGKETDPNTPSTWVPTKESTKQVKELIEPLSYRVRIRDHLKDLPARTIMKRRTEMADEQFTHYTAMEKILRTVIDDKTISVSSKLAQIMKLRQVTGGFIIDHQEEAHPMKINYKLDALDDLVHSEIDINHKIVIYAEYRWEINLIENRYKCYNAVSVYGNNTSKTNMENIKKFIHDDKIRIIVLHPKSAAHGVTFTVAHYMIFYAISYSSEDNYQCIKRIERAGQKNAMFIYYLLARGTIDETIYKVLQTKTKNQSELIDQSTLDEALLGEYSKHEDPG